MKTNKLFGIAVNLNEKWQAQKSYLKDLAEINDIDFNPQNFEDRTRVSGLLHKKYEQSDAAIYVAEQLSIIRQSGRRIFYPWRTCSLNAGFNGKRYNEEPWLYIPTHRVSKAVKDTEVIKAVTFHENEDQETYLGENAGESRRSLSLVCKNCLHEWNHYCGESAGGEVRNPNDVEEICNEDGKTFSVFRCPNCGSVEIYKTGEFFWD